MCQDFNRSMCSRLNCRFVHLTEGKCMCLSFLVIRFSFSIFIIGASSVFPIEIFLYKNHFNFCS